MSLNSFGNKFAGLDVYTCGGDPKLPLLTRKKIVQRNLFAATSESTSRRTHEENTFCIDHCWYVGDRRI